MPRTPRRRQWTDAACYHLMNRGHNRETVFAHDDDRRHFLALLARYRQSFDFRLYHYCLLTNHFHSDRVEGWVQRLIGYELVNRGGKIDFALLLDGPTYGHDKYMLGCAMVETSPLHPPSAKNPIIPTAARILRSSSKMDCGCCIPTVAE